jgi:hypothetical protein
MTRRGLSRRDFLRGATAGSAAIAFLPACNTTPPGATPGVVMVVIRAVKQPPQKK